MTDIEILAIVETPKVWGATVMWPRGFPLIFTKITGNVDKCIIRGLPNFETKNDSS